MARGVPPIVDLDVYAALGLNTVELALDEPLGDDDAVLVLDTLAACERRGLAVIVEIGPPLLDESARVSPGSAAYAEAVRAWVSAVVSRLGRSPAVAAWSAPSELGGMVELDQGDFQALLKSRYATVGDISTAWGAGIRAWSMATIERALTADDLVPLSVGRSTMDYAEWRRILFHGIQRVWYDAIHQADASRPVLLGSLDSYAETADVLPEFSGVLIGARVGGAPDLWSDPLCGLTVARRAGAHSVVLGVPIDRPVIENAELFMKTALLEGAAGFAFEDWPLLRENAVLRNALSETVADLPALDLAHWHPLGAAAYYHLPYADGGTTPGGEGLFGYVKGFSAGSPTLLLRAHAGGSRFGQLDALGTEQLVPEALRRYPVLLAPQCVDLSKDVQATLMAYVQAGGTLVLDLGVGLRQTGSALEFPPGLDMLLGVPRMGQIAPTRADMTVEEAVAPLPSMVPGAETVGVPPGPTIDGPIGDALAGLGAHCIASARIRRGRDGRPYRAGLFAKPFGSGYCVFCTGSLFAHWWPDDPLYQCFFSDLLRPAARAEVMVQDERMLYSDAAALLSAEEGYALVGRAAAPTVVGVRVNDTPGRVFSAGLRRGARGSPGTTVPMEVYAALSAGDAVTLRPLPVRVEGDGWCRVADYGPTHVSLELYGADGTPGLAADGALVVQSREAAKARIIVEPGAPMTGRRRTFEVSRTDLATGRRSARRILAAEADGKLQFDVEARGDLIDIMALAEEP
jgi:hypothetical protein